MRRPICLLFIFGIALGCAKWVEGSSGPEAGETPLTLEDAWDPPPESWRAQNPNPNSFWESPTGGLYFVGNKSILSSQNHGRSWSVYNTGEKDDGSWALLISVWGSSDSDVYVVGEKLTARRRLPYPIFFHSRDGGVTWQEQLPAWDGGGLYEVWGSGPNDVYILSGLGDSYLSGSSYLNGQSNPYFTMHSSDGGKTWTALPEGTLPPFSVKDTQRERTQMKNDYRSHISPIARSFIN